MKRKTIIIAAIAVFMATVPVALYAIPPNVQEARRNAQREGYVTAVGDSGLRNRTAARNAATLSARGAIVRELDAVIKTAEELHLWGLESDFCSFAEEFFQQITTSIAESRLLGSTVVYEYRDAQRHQWVVVALSRDNAIAEVTAAAEAAEAEMQPIAGETAPQAAPQLSRLDMAQLTALDAINRMNQALDLYFRDFE